MAPTHHSEGRHNLKTSFWDSIQKIRGKKREEGVRIFAMLWAIWLHQNDKLFNGRAASIKGIANAVEGFVDADLAQEQRRTVASIHKPCFSRRVRV